MVRWSQSFQKLFGLFFAFAMIACLALPSELHLELCFSQEGHIEIVPNFCIDNVFSQDQSKIVDSFDQCDHLDCNDYSFGHSPQENCFITFDRKSSFRIKGLTFSKKYTAFFIQLPPISSNNKEYQPFQYNYHRSVRPSHLEALRTTILII